MRPPPGKRRNFNSIPVSARVSMEFRSCWETLLGVWAGESGSRRSRSSAALPVQLFPLIEEVADGLDHGMRRGRRVEGQPHFLFGAAEGGAGGHGPGEGAGASSGGQARFAACG